MSRGFGAWRSNVYRYPLLLCNLVYNKAGILEGLNMSYRESNVFKFADKIGVRFLCEIKLCLKIDGGCDGITVRIFRRQHYPVLASKLRCQ
jgi:hypothetical protein